MQNSSPNGLRHFVPRLSVRALMILVLVLGVVMGWYAKSVRRQQNAVAVIKAAGGSVTYDIEWENYNSAIVDPNGKRRVPKWLIERFGVDSIANVVSVNLVPRRLTDKSIADDKTLAYVGQLNRVTSLRLNNTAITDAGLAHIKGLTQLNDLSIGHTKVTDSGIPYLKDMINLKTFFIVGSNITDEGVLDLEFSLPRLQVLREHHVVINKKPTSTTELLAFVRSQPTRRACVLLEQHAMATSNRSEKDELIATIHALCDLEATDKVTLEKLAAARSQCLGIIEPSRTPFLSAEERLGLQARCASRGIAALKLAIELGYKNLRRLDSNEHWEGHLFWNLRKYPGYEDLVKTLKAKHPQ